MTDSFVTDFTETLLRTAQKRVDDAAIRWDALDLNEGISRFAMQKSRSRKPVELPLSEAMLELLEPSKKAGVGPFVFSTGDAAMSDFVRPLQQAHKQFSLGLWCPTLIGSNGAPDRDRATVLRIVWLPL